MNQIIEGLPGVLCLIDYVLISVQNQEEYDLRLQETLIRLQLQELLSMQISVHLGSVP